MLAYILTFMAVSCCLSAITDAKHENLKIFGGKVAGIISKKYNKDAVIATKEFPYMASLEYYRQHVCGAVIIGMDIVLTAAHCVNKREIEGLIVRAGTFTIHDKMGENVQFRRVKYIQIHGKYNKGIEKNNDVALLKFECPFEQDDYVAPIQLPRRTQEGSFVREEAVFLGYGEKKDGFLSQALLKAYFWVIANEQCAYFTEISNKMLCALGRTGSEVACSGDSGGPLVKHYAQSPKSDVLLGVASFVVYDDVVKKGEKPRCNPKIPSGFADVASLRNWIDHASKCTKSHCHVLEN